MCFPRDGVDLTIPSTSFQNCGRGNELLGGIVLKPFKIRYVPVILLWPGIVGCGAALMPTISNFWISLVIGILFLLLIWAIIGKVSGFFDKQINRAWYGAFIGNIGSLFGGVLAWRVAGESVWFGMLLMFLFAGTIFFSYRNKRKVHFLFWNLGGKADQAESSNLKYFGWVLLGGLLVSVGITKSLPSLIILSGSLILSACFSSTAFYQAENPDWRSELGG